MSEPTPEQPRALSAEEMRDEFIRHVWRMARYWASLDGSNVSADATPLDRTTGMAHSILAALDGCADMPAFKVVASPHPDDEAFLREEGENWWPDGVDIAFDTLHEHLYRDDLRGDR